MTKVAVVAVAAALCAVVVKKQTPEIALVLALCAGAVVLLSTADALSSVRTMMDTLSDAAGLSPAVVSPVIKTVGIAMVTRVAAEVCRDAKEGGLAAFVEIAGAVSALLVCLPLMQTVLHMVSGLL